MPAGYLGEILITLGVAWIYLTCVRFVDVNEREPVWALATVFLLGLLGACVAELFVGSEALSVPIWRGAFAVEATKLISLLVGIGIFSAVARLRGWSEFSDLTDGIIYGIAVGLGYSTGETLVRELQTAHLIALQVGHSPLQTAINAAAGGLSHGVFAAVAGLGIGAAFDARGRLAEGLWALLGLAGATLLNGLFRILAHGNALGGDAGHLRAWLAVLLPLVLVVAIGLFSLTRERRVLRSQLAGEVDAGVVSAEAAALLDSFWRRQLGYLRLLLGGRVGQCLHLAALHNRQVQLALLKQRAARESSPAHRARVEAQVALIRNAIRHARTVAVIAVVLLGTLSLGAGKPATRVVRDNWPNVDSLLAASRRLINTYWSSALGSTYRPPVDVGPFSLFSLACPPQKNNARYCRADRHIYYDRDFLRGLWKNKGDFAAAFVLAHEWGHLIQDLRSELGPLSGKWTLEVELGADCLAGQWTRDANAKGYLEPGDENEAVTALRDLRDPPGVDWFQSQAHGSGGQRIDAFTEGLEGRACGGPDFIKAVHAPPAIAQQRVTPSSGPLIDHTSCRRGRFERKSIRNLPESLNEVINDAIQATYESPDGSGVMGTTLAFRNEPAAQAYFDGVYGYAVDQKHYTERRSGLIKDGDTEIGVWKLLEGVTQFVVMRNRQLVTLFEGPTGPTWEMAIATPVYDCSAH